MDLEFDSWDFVKDDSPKVFTALPDGWYDARIMGSEIKTTKAGNGRYISLRYDIIGSDYAGRVVFSNITINNPSASAEGTGRKQLSQIAMAGGMSSLPRDTDELIGLNIKIKVTVQAATEQWAESNDVKGWKPLSGGSQMPPPEKKANGSAAPWAK